MASFEACRNTLTEFRNSTAEVLCIIFSCLKISCINTSVNLQMMHVIQRLQRKAFNRSMKHWFLPPNGRYVKWLVAMFIELKRDDFAFYLQSKFKSKTGPSSLRQLNLSHLFVFTQLSHLLWLYGNYNSPWNYSKIV